MFLLISSAKLSTLFGTTKAFSRKISLYRNIFCSAYILPPIYIICFLFVNHVSVAVSAPPPAKVSHAHPAQKPHRAPHCGTPPPKHPHVPHQPAIQRILASISVGHFGKILTPSDSLWPGDCAAKWRQPWGKHPSLSSRHKWHILWLMRICGSHTSCSRTQS